MGSDLDWSLIDNLYARVKGCILNIGEILYVVSVVWEDTVSIVVQDGAHQLCPEALRIWTDESDWENEKC